MEEVSVFSVGLSAGVGFFVCVGFGGGERTLHRAQTAHLPHQPAQLLAAFRSPRRMADFPLRVVLVC